MAARIDRRKTFTQSASCDALHTGKCPWVRRSVERSAAAIAHSDADRPFAEAFDAVRDFIRSLNQAAAHFELMHVGEVAPRFGGSGNDTVFPVTLQHGDPVDVILATADEKQVDLIAMPTAGHHGFLDALRGSTTERVLRHAACPVLALPADPTN